MMADILSSLLTIIMTSGSFGKFRELIAVNHNVGELLESRQATWRVQITSKNRYKLEEESFKFKHNGTTGTRQRDTGA
jgi:hypothetical protein